MFLDHVISIGSRLLAVTRPGVAKAVVHFGSAMRELILTNDLVLISYVEALLADQGIEALVFDRNISLMEGSIGAFPRRLVVADEVWHRARRILLDAGLGEWIVGHERA